MSKGRTSDMKSIEHAFSTQHGPFSNELKEKTRSALKKRYGRPVTREEVNEVLRSLAGIGRAL